MSEEQEAFRYDKMVEQALRGVVKTALEEVKEKGLFDEHHFYITFRTDYKGVEIPEYLRDRYPGEMTIVLQHQFYDLEVTPEQFTVMLKFNNVPERLQIPLAAITIFTDPSVNFALQFQPLTEDEGLEDSYADEELDPDDGGDSGEVISLDQFRAKGKEKDKKKKDADQNSDENAGQDAEKKAKKAGKKEDAKAEKESDADKSDKNKGRNNDQNNDKSSDD